MIKALLYKDFVNIKTYSLTMLFVGCVLAIIINQPGFSVIATVFASSLVFTSFALDENSGHLKEEIATFGNRKVVVKEKYLLMSIFVLAGTLFSFCYESIMGLIRGTFAFDFSLFCALMALGYGFMICSIALPIIIKVGSEKARLVVILCVFLPMLLVSFLNDIMKVGAFKDSFILILILLIALIATPISYFISCLLISDKDY